MVNFGGTAEIRDKKMWEWLKKGRLKKETEGMIMAAQDQALRTNSIKRIIDRQNVSEKCRMCGEGDETVSHIVSECKKLVQKQYRCWRHDKVAQVIHWDLCGKLGYDREENYYNHEAQPVYESTNNKLLWDFKIQTDNKIEHNKPDIVVLDKIECKCLIIDVACPFDIRVKDKDREKIENYQDLKREVKQICGTNHNWFNCLERYRKVVGGDWCQMPFRIITESVFTGYSQNPLQSLRHLRLRAVT